MCGTIGEDLLCTSVANSADEQHKMTQQLDEQISCMEHRHDAMFTQGDTVITHSDTDAAL